VGIGLLWRERAIYGLAHCLLPDGANRPEGIGAKYVTQAVPSLLRLMQVQRASHDALEAVLAGGANMVHYARRPTHAPIGEQNVRTAQQLLETLGVRVVHVDAGGDCGRQLLIDCHRHSFVVKKISRTL
jgi:chemotaxis protein CheD